MKKSIHLNEAQLKRIIKEAVQAAMQQPVQQQKPQTGYKILYVTQGASINGQPCNRGDVFQDPAQIQWAQGTNAAIKALDMSTGKQYVFTAPKPAPTPEQQQAQQAAQRKYKLATAPVVNKFVSPETQANLHNQAYPGTRNPHIRRISSR